MIFKDGKIMDYVKYGKLLNCVEDDNGNGVGMGSKVNFVYLG